MRLDEALLLDAMAVLVTGYLLLRYPGIRFAHPAAVYWMFHVLIITLRGWSVENGAKTFMDVPPEVIASYLVQADIFLVTATIGWISVRSAPQYDEVGESGVDRERFQRIVLQVGTLAVPIGIFSLVTTAYVPGSDSTVAITSSYQIMAVMWPILIVLAWIYVRGFRFAPMVIFLALLGIMAVQGHSRYRFVIPLVILLVIYLDRSRRKWPPKKVAAVALVAAITFVPLKELGGQVQRGEFSAASYVEVIKKTSGELFAGENAEHALADQGAITLKLAQGQDLMLGEPYLALVTMPVPRAWWPDKPGLADHLKELQTPRYPIAWVGAITTLAGDIRLNFGLVGIILGGFLFGRFTGVWTGRAYASSRYTSIRFLHVLLIALMIQVSRDGLLSVAVFTATSCLPWLVIGILLRRSPHRTHSSDRYVGISHA